jgi:hypothetical protein
MQNATSARGVCDNPFNGKPKASVFWDTTRAHADAVGLPLNETQQSLALKPSHKVAQSKEKTRQNRGGVARSRDGRTMRKPNLNNDADQTTGCSAATVLVVTSLVLLLLGIAVVAINVQWKRAIREFEKNEKLRQQEWVARELRDLDQGNKDYLYFYDHCDPDELLLAFRGRPDVRSVTFELTNVTPKGMGLVAEFPNLRAVTLYGGGGISDECITVLEGHANLEEVRLINVGTTDDALRALKTLPQLRSVTLYYDAYQPPRWTDGSLAYLESLKHLERIVLGGDWFSPRAASRLKAALPDCQITTTATFDDAYRN